MIPASRERHQPHRLVTFLDAIVAIAVTLLVLPLADAAVEADPDEVPLTEFLHEHTGTLLAAGLSFVVIIGLWRSHHDLFERLENYDGLLRSWTFVWVATIVATPFTSQLMARYGSDPLAEVLYIGTLLLASLSQTVMARWMARHPELVHHLQRGDRIDVVVTTSITGLFVVALLLALLVPGVHYAGLFVLLLTRPVVLTVRRLLRRRSVSP